MWLFDGQTRLSPAAVKVISDGSNDVFVSAATALEIAIKKSLGKLKLDGNFMDGLKRYRFTPLTITSEQALAVGDLPYHHRDPFDRLLTVQAKTEGLVLVTRDRHFADYDVDYIEA
ncbi:MAG TPA: type II toxin-antitoxin system VapC family toxin [Trueperaceae bacterium]|nr:type II toxin-antitoxin system VapC family toxin [Trueperaceae bacterium]